jgi:transcriptional regulator with XRE-family HTH domain
MPTDNAAFKQALCAIQMELLMPKIMPRMLKACREAKRLTQEELAEKTRIDKATISRIERGHEEVRGSTLNKLCKCLEVTPEVLAGKEPPPETSFDETFNSKSQLNVRIQDGARNALHLCSERYGISPAWIVELAPFLFEWAATESLKRRREGVERLEGILAQADEARRTTNAHLHPAVSSPRTTKDILRAEKWSIDKRDIWGSWLEADDDVEALAPNYNEYEESPFVLFLKTLGGQTNGLAEFDFWDSGPIYTVCNAEAVALAGGDEKIARSIIVGSIPLHEMPRELRTSPDAAARLEWLRNRHEQAMQKLAEDFPEFADNLEALGELQ